MTEMEDVSKARVTGANSRVSYDVKELFAEIRDELKNLNVTIALKADKAQVDKLEARLDAIEKLGTASAQRAESLSRDAVRSVEAILTDPVWAGRGQYVTSLEKLTTQIGSLKARVYAYGIISATLFAIAGAVAGVIVKVL